MAEYTDVLPAYLEVRQVADLVRHPHQQLNGIASKRGQVPKDRGVLRPARLSRGRHYLTGLRVLRIVNGSLSSVMPANAMHISSVVLSPQPTVTSGSFGFLGLSLVLSKVQVTRTLEKKGTATG